MIRVSFKKKVYGENVKVTASAKDVDAYGAIGLKLKFTDLTGEIVELPFDRDLLEETEEEATDLLYERKYAKELEF